MKINLTRLQKKNFDQLYPKLVVKYIREKYPTMDDEIAIMNNYRADPEKYGEEYAEYQNYRAEVKQALKAAKNN